MQVVCSGDEAAIFTTQDAFCLSVEHLGQLVGSLSLARKLLVGPGKVETLPYCMRDDELWSEGVSGEEGRGRKRDGKNRGRVGGEGLEERVRRWGGICVGTCCIWHSTQLLYALRTYMHAASVSVYL